jgi:hypothetical protein
MVVVIGSFPDVSRVAERVREWLADVARLLAEESDQRGAGT